MANKKVSQLTSKPSVLVTDLFPIADPSTGQLYKTTISDLGTAIGSGVSSVNGLVGAVVLDTDDIQELVSPTNKWFTDTRARAALSASSPLAYNSGTGVFSIPAATSSQNGYLTSTDWTTFNGKQAALSGTGFVKISGTTISYDNSTYLTTSAAATTYMPLSGGSLTGTVTSNSFIITSSQFAVKKDSSATSAAFYGFQNAAGTNRWNFSIDNAETGSGNTGFDFNIYRYDDAGATLSSVISIKRSTGNIGIGTSSNASRTLEVAQSSGYSAGIRIIGNTGGDAKIQFLASGASSQPEIGPTVASPNDLIFGVGGSERLRILSSGNIGIGMTPYTNGLSTALDLVGGAGLFGFNNGFYLNSNAYYTTDWKYKATSGASLIQTGSDGSIEFLNAPSGTINTTVTFTSRMKISGSGNVGIGNNASTVRLFVGGSTNTSAAFAFTAGDSGGNTLFSVRNDGLINSGLQSQSPYNLSTSGRSMIVNSSGDIGYLVSTREAKTNINKLEDVSWLYKLNPVSYNYRKRDNDMNYTEDFDTQNWYGLIADEVEKINEDLVFYNYNDKGKKLAGVEYNNLISALVKGIQDLKAELDLLKN